VKHFKYVPRGKRRAKPSGSEIEHCKWWVERELAAIAPQLVVALGGTAAESFARRPVSVLRERGPMAFGAQAGFVTIHPSFLLRLPPDRNKKLFKSRARSCAAFGRGPPMLPVGFPGLSAGSKPPIRR
jgi:uracil-DNA glycosylase family 4